MHDRELWYWSLRQVSTKACEICAHPKREYVEREVLSGRQTIAWGAEQLGVPYQTFWEHCKSHVSTEGEVEEAKTLADILDELVKELHKRFKRVIKIPVERGNERDVKACVDSLNTCIMNIARLKRIISTAPQIQIEQLNIKMTKLIEFIHTTIPVEYQEKILQFLDTKE